MVLKLDAILIQFLHPLLQLLPQSNYYIKMLVLLYQLQVMALYNMVYIFHLFLDLDM